MGGSLRALFEGSPRLAEVLSRILSGEKVIESLHRSHVDFEKSVKFIVEFLWRLRGEQAEAIMRFLKALDPVRVVIVSHTSDRPPRRTVRAQFSLEVRRWPGTVRVEEVFLEEGGFKVLAYNEVGAILSNGRCWVTFVRGEHSTIATLVYLSVLRESIREAIREGLFDDTDVLILSQSLI